MLTTVELLAAARAAHGIPSNYRLARVLNVSDKSIQRWNTGKNTPDDAMASRLAEMAGLDPDSVVAAMHAERAVTEAERARWQRIAHRLQAVAACVILSLVGFGASPDARATGSHSNVLLSAGSVYYVKSIRRKSWPSPSQLA